MIAIIITIMVLDLKVPAAPTFHALRPILPVLGSYVLSFVNVGIYWNNHHHMLAITKRVRGAVLWANLHLLFWLSLIPYTTAWLGEHPGASAPTVVYGSVLVAASLAYWLLQRTLVQTPGQNSALQAALGSDIKGKICPLIYVIAIGAAFFHPALADALYVFVALLWLIPDQRLEQAASQDAPAGEDPPSP